MKVLLYDTGDVRGELNEPIGIELIGAHILKELEGQITLDIKWFNFDQYSFDPLQYDIIGISIHINGLNVFENVYQLCHECGFKGLIIAGNSIATFAYNQLLGKYPDVICSIGEGEYTITEIVCGYLNDCLDLIRIPNLAYINKGKLITTERVVFDLKEYLPPLRVFNRQLKENMGISRIEASRGCSWNRCSFCGAAHKYNNTDWRPIDGEIILKQLVELSDSGLTTVYFCDEDFIGNDSVRFAQLVEKIQEKMKNSEISPKMKFFISVKPIDITNPTNMKIIKRFMNCGLKDLFVGIESGCESQLRRYNKCTNVNTNLKTIEKIRLLEKDGLSIDIGFIFFDYYMTPDDIKENIRFIEDNQLYTLASSLIKPIRIQPYTKTFTDISEIHMNEFLIDDLMYSYHFADEIVEQIYITYSMLDLESIAHKIQSMYRREMSLIDKRKLVTQKLIKLRYLEFLSIKAISMYYIDKEINESQIKSELSDIYLSAQNLLS